MNWSDQHSANLAALLKSTPLLERLNSTRPKIEGKGFEETALSAKEMAGYERCMAEIVSASEQQSFPTQTSPFVADLEKFEDRPFGAEQ